MATERKIVELDVRIIPPRDKHPRIFQTFDSLQPGEILLIINDHDPRPLRYQFEFERQANMAGNIWKKVQRSGR